jgi:hypothetical protein
MSATVRELARVRATFRGAPVAGILVQRLAALKLALELLGDVELIVDGEALSANNLDPGAFAHQLGAGLAATPLVEVAAHMLQCEADRRRDAERAERELRSRGSAHETDAR